MPINVDVIIFGGGAAGLWVLDELTRKGRSALLLESQALGQWQTIASQGIIHGGLKYSLQGLLTKSAEQIREMPVVWRECLAGRREPNLSQTRLRSDACYLWRTDTITSRLGMLGAKLGLRIAPETVASHDRPDVLRSCPGSAFRLPEQVICPITFLENLADRHPGRIRKVDPAGIQWELNEVGGVRSLHLSSIGNEKLHLKLNCVIFAAGAGNAALRNAVGLPSPVMQRRPLHMVMLRGRLPVLNGHCVDGAKTRITVTSTTDSRGDTIWQVGGQLTEDGVNMEPGPLLRHARSELLASIPGLDLSRAEGSTYRADRAEAKTAAITRPETAQVIEDQNILTAWPTKLALAPKLAERLCELVCQSPPVPANPAALEVLKNWPRPEVATPPWETATEWYKLDGEFAADKSAA